MAHPQRELVFCHGCGNEWHQDDHGLQCPRCESEFVEVVSFPTLVIFCNEIASMMDCGGGFDKNGETNYS